MLKRLLFGLAGTALGIGIAVAIVPGLDFSGSWVSFALVTLIFSGLNVVVRPILKLLSLPLILATFGLFLLVINAVMLQLTLWLSSSDVLNLGFSSDGFFWSTFLGAVVISLVQMLANALLGTDGG